MYFQSLISTFYNPFIKLLVSEVYTVALNDYKLAAKKCKPKSNGDEILSDESLFMFCHYGCDILL